MPEPSAVRPLTCLFWHKQAGFEPTGYDVPGTNVITHIQSDPEKKFTGTGQLLDTDLDYAPSTGTNAGSDPPCAEKTPSVVVADIDGTTYDKIIVGNYGGPNYVYLQDPTSAKKFPIRTPIGTLDEDDPNFDAADFDATPFTTMVVMADLDGDGYADIVVTNRTQKDQIFFPTESGGAPFDHESLPTAVSTTFGPFNAEKDPDIYVKDAYGADHSYGENTPNWPDGFLGAEWQDSKFSTEDVAVADFNNDGVMDIATAVDDAPITAEEIFLNPGTGEFTVMRKYWTGLAALLVPLRFVRSSSRSGSFSSSRLVLSLLFGALAPGAEAFRIPNREVEESYSERRLAVESSCDSSCDGSCSGSCDWGCDIWLLGWHSCAPARRAAVLRLA